MSGHLPDQPSTSSILVYLDNHWTSWLKCIDIDYTMSIDESGHSYNNINSCSCGCQHVS